MSPIANAPASIIDRPIIFMVLSFHSVFSNPGYLPEPESAPPARMACAGTRLPYYDASREKERARRDSAPLSWRAMAHKSYGYRDQASSSTPTLGCSRLSARPVAATIARDDPPGNRFRRKGELYHDDERQQE